MQSATPEYRQPDVPTLVLLVVTALTCSIFWLPLVRGLMDGPAYEWGNFGFSGHGVHGDYWFPVTATFLSIAVLLAGWRCRNALFLVPATLWYAFLTYGSVMLAMTAPDTIRFQGETMGVDFSLALVAPILSGMMLLLALYVLLVRTPPTQKPYPWNRINTVLLGTVVLLVPMQYILLSRGAIHGFSDQVGVLVTLAQWALLNASFYPWKPKQVKTTTTTDASMTELP